MCGPSDSILGREPAAIIRRFTHSLPVSFPIAQGPVHICGAMIEIDQTTGRAESIQRIREVVRV
jgi:calcineurin-like phosphoesterase